MAPPAWMLHVRQEKEESRAIVNYVTKVRGKTRQELRRVKRAQVHTSPQRLLAPNLTRNVYVSSAGKEATATRPQVATAIHASTMGIAPRKVGRTPANARMATAARAVK